ncbi:PAS domain-containing hybrid sensor histidine kinase/response regulator [Hymenobacter aquaticus]|uniref:PAS domain-containing hybrid sensor histidine kinase/response regulator n=1 Tax=Hymenobacter aquaticus TaxID=1867101 RepID=UPI001436BDD6|nr:PAS domain S-box protein [Hymenobacter aquaticus]
MKESYSGPPASHWEQELQLLQQAFDAVVVLDAQGRLLWANAGFARLRGASPALLPSQQPWQLLRGSGPGEIAVAYLDEQLRTGRAFRYETNLAAPAAAPRWVRVRIQPLPAAPGEAARFVGLLEDIGEAKATQQALSESEQRFRYLTEQVPGVLFQWHETAGLVYLSPKVTDIFGVDAAQAPQLLGFLHPQDQPRWERTVRQAALKARSWTFEGRLLVPGQPLRWCRVNASQDQPGAAGRLYNGIMVDITALKQAEETVQANEQRWQLAMERFGDGAWEFNYQTGEEYFSGAYQAMLGYTEEEFALEPQTWLTHVHPDDIEASLLASEAYLRGDEPIYSIERRMRCKNGDYKWVLTRGLVTKVDEQGKPLIMTGVHTDISALKNANAAIEASRLRLSTTIANFQEGILLVDEHHRVVLANEAICRLFSSPLAPRELVGRDARLFGEQAKNLFRHAEEFVARYQTLVQSRQLVTGEIFPLKNGRILQCDFVPIFVDATYIGYLWKFQDITERRNNEETLRRREEKYRGIIENMRLGLVERDHTGAVAYVNEAFCDITGFTSDELLKQQGMQHVLGEAGALFVAEKSQNRFRGVAETYEMPITTKAGPRRWLLVSGAPVYDDERRVCGSISITLDITHQKELEHNLRAAKESAEESARSKELFLANMSHEIRTPLNAILGMGQLLAKTPLNDEQHNYLRAIATSGENLLVIINDILDLSKIGASQLSIERIGFNLAALLAQVEKSLHFKAEEKGLRFVVSAAAGLPPVLLGDPYRITQVLLNLAGNAIKFTEKGHVSITGELVEPLTAGQVALRFTVADTGVGIDADYLGDIFKEFSQEDSSVTRKYGGTGLGLSISRQLVNLMGGEIEIVSQKNQGTRSAFTLLLAVGSEADLPQKSVVTADTRQRLRGKRVLLTEDNAFNRQIAKGFLQNAGLLVAEAENGAVALELAGRQRFDVILMDVQMPVMNGLEATSHLRGPLALNLPIIALTANAIKGEREKCLAAGMNDYLAKPFQEEDLLKVISRWTLEQPPPAAALPAPYSLAIIEQIGQGAPDFMVLMLESFIESAQEAIAELEEAARAQDVPRLRAATHKLKPSLEHLQVQHLLPPVHQLDTWRGPFEEHQLQPLIAQVVEQLQQLLGLLENELRTARQNLTSA